ncbi:MAG: glycosyltransferase family 2 protein [Candidatus Omnitrophica bacterium]|nr:glycosyltransferase family 2 protein [Candidatus Omnitrophota bacterium]
MVIPVAVVVITRNEEANLEACLSTVKDWAQEIIVVDDGSTDRTLELAGKFTDKVFSRRMDNEGRHRNWAYAKASTPWVLSLDADERVTPELRAEITALFAGSIEGDGYNIPRRNYIGSYWLRHGGQYPAAQLRLFKKDCFKYEEAGVHPRAFMTGKVFSLKGDIIHYSYRDFAHFVSKMNGQTTLEAGKWVDSNRQMSFGVALWRSIDRFFRSFIGKKGYKDGFYGFMMGVFASFYQIISYAKYIEMLNNKKNAEALKK